MLILSRNVGERIIIDDHIFITVLGVRGQQIRIGIDAPQQVTVHREEIQKRIEEARMLKTTTCITYTKSKLAQK